jgi:hypothetical protein
MDVGRLDELLEAVDSLLPHQQALQDVAKRCCISGIHSLPNERFHSGAPGYLLSDALVGGRHERAEWIDVPGMFGVISGRVLDLVEPNEDYRQALGRLARTGLGAWLDNPKWRPYRLHLASGAKGDAISVSVGLSKLQAIGQMTDAHLAELAKGKRGARLTKTLRRAEGLLGKPQDAKNREDIITMRVRLSRSALSSLAQDQEGVRPARTTQGPRTL